MNSSKATIHGLLDRVGLGAAGTASLAEVERLRALDDAVEFMKRMPESQLGNLFRYLDESKAQLRQDLFALAMLGFKKNGFFVEFGATDGVGLSNSWLLEKHFEWDGILAEPGRKWQNALKQNRTCSITSQCVWTESGEELKFHDADLPELSTIADLSKNDMHAKSRQAGTDYLVSTISLHDLLTECKAPRTIDYMSVDTEGSELSILTAFPFDQWQISIITVEHNYTDDREKLRNLLEANGYTAVFPNLSEFDDWYLHDSLGERESGVAS